MGLSSLSLFIFMALFSLTHSSPPMQMQPLCHGDDSSALLQLKQSLFFTPPVLASWTLELNKSDCCSWDGVECDDNTGRVIGLDLSSSILSGSISSTSSLFRLVHLQRLNLAHNDFFPSSIPPQVRNLSRLTHLNLSFSNFSGEIPLEISQLSQLSSLDLSQDYSLLKLKKASLRTLVGNLTHLQELDLSGVDISSTVPNILANLSSLTSLSLHGCGLHGEFPVGIFKLSNLRVLDVGANAGLTGYLPNFTWSSPLQSLDLTGTSFLGELSASVGNLSFLTFLSVKDCNFSGSIPSSLGNLTKLTKLGLSYNTFVGNIPHSLGNLVQLFDLAIGWNQLTGHVPFRLVNLPLLIFLDLSHNLLSGEIKFENATRLIVLGLNNNQLTGPITFGPMNLTRLRLLDLACNKFHGQIANSIFNFMNLEFLYLFENYFNGTLEFDEFLKLKHLHELDISGNQLSLLIKETSSANATLHEFEYLGFSSCNLSEVPNFIRSQHELKNLNLSNNKIHGQVPEWMWNTSTTSLEVLDLSNNLLTGFSQHPILFPWTHLRFLDLRSNLLQGSLPTPPISTSHFYISNNLLIGNIPESFCNLSSLQVLDLANNNLSGSLPQCSDNFGGSLLVLDLRRNKFQGSIPETWINGSQLGIINFSQNKFQGQLPRSMAECTMLKVLDLSDNQFNDTFPFWLGHLPNLKVLRLRSNKFNGPMETPQTYFKCPNIQILDISYNDFMGKLPLRFFENWKAKEFEDDHMLTYIHENSDFQPKRSWYDDGAWAYPYSMVMTNKGNDVFYQKVQEVFTAIDFSSNRFVGEIPESIGNLKGAQLLNLSNNVLAGPIPPSLGNLTKLEALDLSHNKLSGEIPSELTQLHFLGFFNVSHNNLMGLIPQGRHFDTFDNSSFKENPRLCGRPLTRKCENSNEPHSQESQDSGSPFEFGWKIVVIGYGFGFVVGVIIGLIVIARKHDWLMKTLRIRPPGGRRRKN
jgi:Leucine-rich repeat (LRR) protein